MESGRIRLSNRLGPNHAHRRPCHDDINDRRDRDATDYGKWNGLPGVLDLVGHDRGALKAIPGPEEHGGTAQYAAEPRPQHRDQVGCSYARHRKADIETQQDKIDTEDADQDLGSWRDAEEIHRG